MSHLDGQPRSQRRWEEGPGELRRRQEVHSGTVRETGMDEYSFQTELQQQVDAEMAKLRGLLERYGSGRPAGAPKTVPELWTSHSRDHSDTPPHAEDESASRVSEEEGPVDLRAYASRAGHTVSPLSSALRRPPPQPHRRELPPPRDYEYDDEYTRAEWQERRAPPPRQQQRRYTPQYASGPPSRRSHPSPRYDDEGAYGYDYDAAPTRGRRYGYPEGYGFEEEEEERFAVEDLRVSRPSRGQRRGEDERLRHSGSGSGRASSGRVAYQPPRRSQGLVDSGYHHEAESDDYYDDVGGYDRMQQQGGGRQGSAHLPSLYSHPTFAHVRPPAQQWRPEPYEYHDEQGYGEAEGEYEWEEGQEEEAGAYVDARGPAPPGGTVRASAQPVVTEPTRARVRSVPAATVGAVEAPQAPVRREGRGSAVGAVAPDAAPATQAPAPAPAPLPIPFPEEKATPASVQRVLPFTSPVTDPVSVVPRRNRWREAAPTVLVHDAEAKGTLDASVARIRSDREAFRSRSRSRGAALRRDPASYDIHTPPPLPRPLAPVSPQPTTDPSPLSTAITASTGPPRFEPPPPVTTLSLVSSPQGKPWVTSPYRALPPLSRGVTASEALRSLPRRPFTLPTSVVMLHQGQRRRARLYAASRAELVALAVSNFLADGPASPTAASGGDMAKCIQFRVGGLTGPRVDGDSDVVAVLSCGVEGATGVSRAEASDVALVLEVSFVEPEVEAARSPDAPPESTVKVQSPVVVVQTPEGDAADFPVAARVGSLLTPGFQSWLAGQEEEGEGKGDTKPGADSGKDEKKAAQTLQPFPWLQELPAPAPGPFSAVNALSAAYAAASSAPPVPPAPAAPTGKSAGGNVTAPSPLARLVDTATAQDAPLPSSALVVPAPHPSRKLVLVMDTSVCEMSIASTAEAEPFRERRRSSVKSASGKLLPAPPPRAPSIPAPEEAAGATAAPARGLVLPRPLPPSLAVPSMPLAVPSSVPTSTRIAPLSDEEAAPLDPVPAPVFPPAAAPAHAPVLVAPAPTSSSVAPAPAPAPLAPVAPVPPATADDGDVTLPELRARVDSLVSASGGEEETVVKVPFAAPSLPAIPPSPEPPSAATRVEPAPVPVIALAPAPAPAPIAAESESVPTTAPAPVLEVEVELVSPIEPEVPENVPVVVAPVPIASEPATSVTTDAPVIELAPVEVSMEPAAAPAVTVPPSAKEAPNASPILPVATVVLPLVPTTAVVKPLILAGVPLARPSLVPPAVPKLSLAPGLVAPVVPATPTGAVIKPPPSVVIPRSVSALGQAALSSIGSGGGLGGGFGGGMSGVLGGLGAGAGVGALPVLGASSRSLIPALGSVKPPVLPGAGVPAPVVPVAGRPPVSVPASITPPRPAVPGIRIPASTPATVEPAPAAAEEAVDAARKPVTSEPVAKPTPSVRLAFGASRSTSVAAIKPSGASAVKPSPLSQKVPVAAVPKAADAPVVDKPPAVEAPNPDAPVVEVEDKAAPAEAVVPAETKPQPSTAPPGKPAARPPPRGPALPPAASATPAAATPPQAAPSAVAQPPPTAPGARAPPRAPPTARPSPAPTAAAAAPTDAPAPAEAAKPAPRGPPPARPPGGPPAAAVPPATAPAAVLPAAAPTEVVAQPPPTAPTARAPPRGAPPGRPSPAPPGTNPLNVAPAPAKAAEPPAAEAGKGGRDPLARVAALKAAKAPPPGGFTQPEASDPAPNPMMSSVASPTPPAVAAVASPPAARPPPSGPRPAPPGGPRAAATPPAAIPPAATLPAAAAPTAAATAPTATPPTARPPPSGPRPAPPGGPRPAAPAPAADAAPLAVPPPADAPRGAPPRGAPPRGPPPSGPAPSAPTAPAAAEEAETAAPAEGKAKAKAPSLLLKKRASAKKVGDAEVL